MWQSSSPMPATSSGHVCRGETTPAVGCLSAYSESGRVLMSAPTSVPSTVNTSASARTTLSSSLTRETDAASAGLARTLPDRFRLDRAVLGAYGWADLDANVPTFAAVVLTRLVALNAKRALEEGRGFVRYLRPSFRTR